MFLMWCLRSKVKKNQEKIKKKKLININCHMFLYCKNRPLGGVVVDVLF